MAVGRLGFAICCAWRLEAAAVAGMASPLKLLMSPWLIELTGRWPVIGTGLLLFIANDFVFRVTLGDSVLPLGKLFERAAFSLVAEEAEVRTAALLSFTTAPSTCCCVMRPLRLSTCMGDITLR